ncbi:hypothetical protein EDD18DRAFT_1327856 [Armillaria luteobubalina]|uniref:Uncharacterized protein n=1 Tax=Armillaria luteobubalina TaxID=153913 RepID=A0AA39QHI9_9AGAR|nr:hypothetical protein EDD18DRAFT_1327856 [Armillaria luteobubalina]
MKLPNEERTLIFVLITLLKYNFGSNYFVPISIRSPKIKTLTRQHHFSLLSQSHSSPSPRDAVSLIRTLYAPSQGGYLNLILNSPLNLILTKLNPTEVTINSNRNASSQLKTTSRAFSEVLMNATRTNLIIITHKRTTQTHNSPGPPSAYENCSSQTEKIPLPPTKTRRCGLSRTSHQGHYTTTVYPALLPHNCSAASIFVSPPKRPRSTISHDATFVSWSLYQIAPLPELVCTGPPIIPIEVGMSRLMVNVVDLLQLGHAICPNFVPTSITGEPKSVRTLRPTYIGIIGGPVRTPKLLPHDSYVKRYGQTVLDAGKQDTLPRVDIEASFNQIGQGIGSVHGLGLVHNNINHEDGGLVIIDFDPCRKQDFSSRNDPDTADFQNNFHGVERYEHG